MKKQRMRSRWLAARATLCGVGVLCLAGTVQAGSMDPPDPPGPTMYTLEEIYQKLEMVNAKIPTADWRLQYGDATAGDILAGQTALVQGVPVTGTMETRTLSVANDAVEAGYYAATTLSTVDADLAAANIVDGMNVFGVLGTFAGGGAPAPLAKTGQTNSYWAGDDGTYQAGMASPSPRFTDNGNDTVTDNLTGLMWTKNANIWGALVWDAAIDHCSYILSGYGDWRLPNVHEMFSLIDKGGWYPVLPTGHPFTNVQSSGYYWTSTTLAAGTSSAWYIFMGDGFVYYGSGPNKSWELSVWPVRSGL